MRITIRNAKISYVRSYVVVLNHGTLLEGIVVHIPQPSLPLSYISPFDSVMMKEYSVLILVLL